MYKETDYLYAGARIRAYEGRQTNPLRVDKLLEAKNFTDALSVISQYEQTEARVFDYEAYFEAKLEESYRLCEDSFPNDPMLRIFRYQYDCQNLKSALKCDALGTSPDGILFKIGNVEPEKVKESVRTRDFSYFSEAVSKAAAAALGSFGKTRDPQFIDIYIDKACFADMLSSAKDFGCDFITDYVMQQIDRFNITAFFRCVKMNKSVAFYESLSCDGGYVERKSCIEAYGSGLPGLFDVLSSSVYTELFKHYNASSFSELSFSAVERIFDKHFSTKLDSVKFIPIGPVVLAEYILRRERDIKNMRLVLAGKRVSLSNEEIRRNLR